MLECWGCIPEHITGMLFEAGTLINYTVKAPDCFVLVIDGHADVVSKILKLLALPLLLAMPCIHALHLVFTCKGTYNHEWEDLYRQLCMTNQISVPRIDSLYVAKHVWE